MVELKRTMSCQCEKQDNRCAQLDWKLSTSQMAAAAAFMDCEILINVGYVRSDDAQNQQMEHFLQQNWVTISLSSEDIDPQDSSLVSEKEKEHGWRAG
jgi:hypothetical protein